MRAVSWIWINLLPILLIAGTTVSIAGASTLTGLTVGTYLGTWAGVAAAATVAGGLTAAAALRASRLAVIYDEGRSQ